jgi:hypothetical protein
MKWHRVFGLVLSLTCLLAVPRAFANDKSEDSKKKAAPAKQPAPPPKAQPAPSAPPARTSPQPVAQPAQAAPNATPAKTVLQSGYQPTQAAPNVPSAKTGSQSGAPATKTGLHLAPKPVAEQTSPVGTASAPKSVAGTPAKKQPRERSEDVPSDAQDAPSSEVIETNAAVPESPSVIEPVAPVPVPEEEHVLTPADIENATAPLAPANLTEPVTPHPVTPVPARDSDVAPLPKVSEVVTQNEKTTVRSQVVEQVVKPIDHRVPQKKNGPSQLSVGEPSMVRKVDGQYAVWNHGSAQGVQVGDEVKLVRGAAQIGRAQVIAVRANDCDLEIVETYAVALVAVGDRVKPLGRAIMP